MRISTVPVVFVNAALRSAKRHGCNVLSLIQESDISEGLLTEEKARVETEKFIYLSKRITEELKDGNGGFTDEPISPGTLSLLCYACIHCPTLGSFLERGIHFYHIVNASYKLEIKRQDGYAEYTITPHASLHDPDNYVLLPIMGIIHRLACWVAGKNIPLQSVSYTHERPQHASEYNLFFKAPIKFNQTVNGFKFNESYLDLPNVQTEQTLEKMFLFPALEFMSIPDFEESFIDKVKGLLSESITSEMPPLEFAAETLNVSSATLKRRLKEDGTSYKNLKDDVRRDFAIYHLSRGGLTIEEIAVAVGFSEATSFYRAFRRWTGVSPRDYIKD